MARGRISLWAPGSVFTCHTTYTAKASGTGMGQSVLPTGVFLFPVKLGLSRPTLHLSDGCGVGRSGAQLVMTKEQWKPHKMGDHRGQYMIPLYTLLPEHCVLICLSVCSACALTRELPWALGICTRLGVPP